MKWVVAFLTGAGALVVAFAVVVQVVIKPNLGQPGTADSRLVSAAALATILDVDADLPAGYNVHRVRNGLDALSESGTAPLGSAGFVDAVLKEFDSDNDHVGEHEDLYWAFAAVFDSMASAELAFDAAVARHESADGWGPMRERPLRDEDPAIGVGVGVGVGDESIHYVAGSEYGYPELSVYLWRVDNLLLHAVDFHPYDREALLADIVRKIDERARRV